MAVNEHGRGADQFSLRLPPGMRDRIKVAAEISGRSMNAELIAALEEKFPPQSDAELEDALRVIEVRIARAPTKQRKELQELREKLVVALYFEPPEQGE